MTIAVGLALLTLAVLLAANAVASEAEDHWGAFSARAPLYALTAILVVLIALAAGAAMIKAFALAAVWLAALCIIEADLRWLVIPDVAVLILLAGALFGAGGDFSEAALGAGLSGGMMLAVRYGFLWLRGAEGLGWGDIKLAAAMGAGLGPHLALSALAAAAGATALFVVYRIWRGASVLRVENRPAAPLGVGLAAATLGASCLRLAGAA